MSTTVESKIHKERIAALDALAATRQAEREALHANHGREIARLSAAHEAAREAHDAESIEMLERAEKDAQRRFAEAEAEIVNEDVPKLKAMLAAFVNAPSVSAAKEIIAAWIALAARCDLELGENPHHHILLAGLCGDDPRLATAIEHAHRQSAGHELARAIESGTVGPVQCMAKLLAIAGEIEARLSKVQPNETRFAAMGEHVARSEVERLLGIEHGIVVEDGRVWDGKRWRDLPAGKSPADVIPTSTIAESFKQRPQMAKHETIGVLEAARKYSQ
jgi:hypothetical protein